MHFFPPGLQVWLPHSVFKHKTAQSGAALISYKKDSFTDAVMNIYQHHFCIQLQPKVNSNSASDWCLPLTEDDFSLVSNQSKHLKRLNLALDWMRDIFVRSFPDNYTNDNFRGFTSANLGEDLDDQELWDYGPKLLDHS